jgi:hypothetical protein
VGDTFSQYVFLSRGVFYDPESGETLVDHSDSSLRRNVDTSKLSKEASLKEMRTHLLYGSFKPVKPGGSESSRFALPSKLFCKPKYGPLGELLKFKARWVVGGHRQRDPSVDTSSPVARFETILFALNAALNKKLEVRSADVVAAFLESELDEPEFVTVKGDVADLLCEADPTYEEFRHDDGSIRVELKKAVYGLKQGSSAFYAHVSQILLGAGFVKSQADRALFIHTAEDGEKTFLLTYVDDFLIAGSSAKLDWVSNLLRESFKELTFSEPGAKTLSYLGMFVEFLPDSIRLSQPGFVEDVLKAANFPPNDKSRKPYSSTLHQPHPDSPLLPGDDREAFRSLSMKLNYLATRTRPDIKLPTNWLSTVMSNPTQADKAKLHKCLAYLNQTSKRRMVIRPGPMTLHADADAGFATFEGGKALLGGRIHLGAEGSAPVCTICRKGPTVATSTTIAETQALYEVAIDVVWFRVLCEETGFPQETNTVDQDNQSTIRVMTRGAGWGGKTKMLELKYYWITEQIDTNVLALAYVKSEDLPSDGYTKVVTSNGSFEEWVNHVLGRDD